MEEDSEVQKQKKKGDFGRGGCVHVDKLREMWPQGHDIRQRWHFKRGGEGFKEGTAEHTTPTQVQETNQMRSRGTNKIRCWIIAVLR